MGSHLKTVDELGEGDILMVVKDVDCAEIALGSVPELEPQELTSIWRGCSAELNSQGRTKVGYTRINGKEQEPEEVEQWEKTVG